jgi:hypothetical protein
MANVRSRTAAPPPPPAALPLPAPRRSLCHRAALSRACEMRRTASLSLAAAGVISGRTSASGRLYVPQSRRRIRSPGRLRAEGCGWDGRGVVSTVRGSARHGGGQGAAARRHREQQQLSTWWRGCWGRASGGPAAEDISARPKYKGRLCACTARRLLECRWRWEALVPSARCGGGERRAGGGGHRRATQAQGPPSTRYRIGSLACVPPPPSAGWQSRMDVEVCVVPRRCCCCETHNARALRTPKHGGRYRNGRRRGRHSLLLHRPLIGGGRGKVRPSPLS